MVLIAFWRFLRRFLKNEDEWEMKLSTQKTSFLAVQLLPNQNPNFWSIAREVKIQNKFDFIFSRCVIRFSEPSQMRQPLQNDLFNCQGIQNKRPQNEKRRYSLMINRFQFTFLLSTISHFPNFCLLSARDVGLRDCDK